MVTRAPVLRETAAQHLVVRVPRTARTARVGDVLAGLPGHAFDSAEALYVVDGEGRLEGLVRLVDALAAPADRTVEALIRRAPAVLPETDQEIVATTALRHGLAEVPVIDGRGTLLGAVPARALLEVLRREHVEDLHRLAGIRRETAQARGALEAPPTRRARDRLPWLIAGLIGSGVATFVVSRFERALEERVALAFFVPGIVYLADAVGTQTEAVVVRGLSVSRLGLRQLLAGELSTGFLIGVVLGALGFSAVAAAFVDLRLALSVALAIFASSATATTIGLLLPWALERTGRDPALGSGPVGTIVQDVLSLLLYFAIATLIAA